MPDHPRSITLRVATLAISVLLTLAATAGSAEEPAVVDDSKSSQRLQEMKRRPGTKPVVAIYEVRSVVPGVVNAAALDMFTTALVKSGAFSVAERSRLNEGVMRERQLNATGSTTGQTASARPAGARYVLEAVVSEGNAGEKQGSAAVAVGGLQVNSGSTQDSIAMDVRIVDVETGLVQDSINVRKKIESSSTDVRGVGQAARSVAGLFGKSVPLAPDVATSNQRKDSVDRAVRDCMETAVHELARRLAEE